VTFPATLAESTELCPIAGEVWFDRWGCQPSGLLAIADYTKGDYNLYARPDTITTTFTAIAPISSTSFSGVQSTDFFRNGAKIQNTGEYIEYNTGAIISAIGGSIDNKKISIEV
jgi:hypothetical protein